MFNNPYQSALAVNPDQEKQAIVALKSNHKKMAELGLQPNTDLSTLKSTNPQAYNKFQAYIKGQVYGGSPYEALAGGQSQGQFVTSQLGDYSATPSEYEAGVKSGLKQEYKIPELQKTYQGFEESAYTAPQDISKQVIEEGGYNIPGLQEEYAQIKSEARQAYADWKDGKISRSEYSKAISELNNTQRNLETMVQGYEREVTKGLGQFEQKAKKAENQFNNAYAQFKEALASQKAGYTESRTEKIANLEDMFSSVKDMLDTYREEEKAYQKELGNIYNPSTGKYENKPAIGGSGTKPKAMTDEFKAWYYNTFGGIATPDNKDAVAEWERWQGTGAALRLDDNEAAGEYFSKPDPATGQIQYYYGDPDKVSNAQKITSQQYLAGKSTASDNVGSDIQATPEEVKQMAKEDALYLIEQKGIKNRDTLIQQLEKEYGDRLYPEELKAVEEVLDEYYGGGNRNFFGNVRRGILPGGDRGGLFFGQYPGKG